MSEEVTPAETTQPETTTEVEKTFNQAEVDKIVQDRVARERAKYADYDTLKTNYAELQSTVSKLDEIKAESFEQGKAEATSHFVSRLIESEIVSTANALGFTDPSDALTFFGDKDSVSYDAETGVDKDAVQTRLTELAEQKSYLIKPNGTTGTATNLPSRPRPKSAEKQAPTEEPLKGAAALRQAFAKKTN